MCKPTYLPHYLSRCISLSHSLSLSLSRPLSPHRTHTLSRRIYLSNSTSLSFYVLSLSLHTGELGTALPTRPTTDMHANALTFGRRQLCGSWYDRGCSIRQLAGSRGRGRGATHHTPLLGRAIAGRLAELVRGVFAGMFQAVFAGGRRFDSFF